MDCLAVVQFEARGAGSQMMFEPATHSKLFMPAHANAIFAARRESFGLPNGRVAQDVAKGILRRRRDARLEFRLAVP